VADTVGVGRHVGDNRVMPDFDDGRAETEIPSGTTVETDVLIVGSGPAGGAAALAWPRSACPTS
jgi:NADPH-dependent 2,4-dienoyl-CoA reductase/sulfur reductase-like enzyme